MSMENLIKEKLTQSLNPNSLTVLNESDSHSHHAGSPGTGESHFRVSIVAEIFKNKSRVERHRMVNTILADELRDKIHALAVKAQTPEEAKAEYIK